MLPNSAVIAERASPTRRCLIETRSVFEPPDGTVLVREDDTWELRRIAAALALAPVCAHVLPRDGGYDVELRAPAIDLASCKIAISIIDRFELAAVDRDARLRQQTHLATEIDEARTHPADRRAIVLAEIGNHLVIGNEPSE